MGPIGLTIRSIATEILLEDLVKTFSLTIGLAVVTRGQGHISSKKFEEAGPELGDELRTTIADDLIWNAIKSDDCGQEHVGS